MLHPQQFRQRADAHWCPTPYDMRLVTLSTKHKKRGSKTVPAHWKKKVKGERLVLLLKGMSVEEEGVGEEGGRGL